MRSFLPSRWSHSGLTRLGVMALSGALCLGVAAPAAVGVPAVPPAQDRTTSQPLCSPTLYVVDFNGSIRMASTASNVIVGSPIDIGDTPGSIVLTANQDTAYVTNNGGGISVVDLMANQVTATIADSNVPTGIAMSSDGSTVYVANTNPSSITSIDTATNVPTTTALPSIGGGYGIAASTNAPVVYMSAYSQSDQNVYVLDSATFAITETIPTGSHNKGIALSPSGQQLWVAGDSSSSINVISTTTNTIIANIPVGANPERVRFAPDGESAWVTNLGGNTVTVIDAGTLAPVATYAAGPLPFDVALSADGTRAYVSNSLSSPSSSPTGTVTVLDTTTGATVATITGLATPDNLAIGPVSCQSVDTSACKNATGPNKQACVLAQFKKMGMSTSTAKSYAFLSQFHSAQGTVNLKKIFTSCCKSKAVSTQLRKSVIAGVQASGKNLSRLSIKGLSLPGGTFNGATMASINARGTTLDGGRFVNANLSKATLVGASLKGANFQGANLGSVNAQNANFSGANFQSSQMKGSAMQGADISDANLSTSDLSGANLQGADLSNSNLQGAQLQNANLAGADLSSAKVSGATFDNTTMPDGSLCSGAACASKLSNVGPITPTR